MTAAPAMMQRARLVLSFSPNPVYHNHPSNPKWYFDGLVQELNGVGATLQHLQAQKTLQHSQPNVRDSPIAEP
jgi:hypothetical protein